MIFHGSRPVFMIFQGSKLVFHGSRSVFMVFNGSRLIYHGFRPVFMVFHGSRLAFHGSRLVSHGFPWFFMVSGWLFMVFLQNVPPRTVSWPDDPI